jgi:hypothetical protein
MTAGDRVVNLALTFGTLLSSQGTDASFVLTHGHCPRLSSGRFPSVLRFRLYQIFPIRFPRGPAPLSRNSAIRGFPFRRGRTLPVFSRPSDHLPADMQKPIKDKVDLIDAAGMKDARRRRSAPGRSTTVHGGHGAAQIVCRAPLRQPTGTSRSEPGLFMTYSSEQYAVQDRQ